MLIGRKKELIELNKLFETDKSELIAIYGRRRVGKTFLIDEVYGNKLIFRNTGIPPTATKNNKEKLSLQIQNFYFNLINYGLTESRDIPKNWLEAFHMLETGIKNKYNNKRVVIFLDELPWMATPNSFFIESFSNFWNNFCVPSKNIVLVVCGSSSSWILSNVIYNKGGLYNRVTHQMKLLPFTLKEVEDFFLAKNIHYSRYEITQAYMAFGGIPYYLDYFRNDYSVAQNIDALLFNPNSYLSNEFEDLFSSQFSNHEKYKAIVEILYDKKIGYTISELANKMGLSGTNGQLYEMINALERGGFIINYVPFKGNKRESKYKLIDPFCLFYLKNVKGVYPNTNYWLSNNNTTKINVWRGLAFENLCYIHIEQIKKRIGISGVSSSISMWSKNGNDNQRGAQIDLIIERKDNIINLCEMKYYVDLLTNDKESHLNLMNKMESLRVVIPKRNSIQNVLITTFGITKREYASDYSIVITIDDLFED